MKLMVVISTGRCGTTRLAEILKESLDAQKFTVNHQVGWSRLANVLGNIMLLLGSSKALKRWVFKKVVHRHWDMEHYVTTDPLISHIIPEELVSSADVAILHVVRDRDSFAKSFYDFSRGRAFSFIAHNFIPFWQPHLWLLENLVKGEKVKEKYAAIADFKKDLFEEMYSKNPNYRMITMGELYKGEVIARYVSGFFGTEFVVAEGAFSKKANQSVSRS